MAVSPKQVGEIAVRKTLQGKMMIVPGALSKFSSFLIRILPRKWIVTFYGKVGSTRKSGLHFYETGRNSIHGQHKA